METRLSKTLSYLLRHEPRDGNLDMDAQGFVAIEDLLEELQTRSWPELSREDFLEQLDDPQTERFERRGPVVRATYGHSVEVELDYPKADPSFPLYHGTTPDAWTSIREEGLKPMSRQYVHLSRTIPEAKRVGHRHCTNPIILQVKEESNNPIDFYRAGPVVLVKQVPPEWLTEYQP